MTDIEFLKSVLNSIRILGMDGPTRMIDDIANRFNNRLVAEYKRGYGQGEIDQMGKEIERLVEHMKIYLVNSIKDDTNGNSSSKPRQFII